MDNQEYFDLCVANGWIGWPSEPEYADGWLDDPNAFKWFWDNNLWAPLTLVVRNFNTIKLKGENDRLSVTASLAISGVKNAAGKDVTRVYLHHVDFEPLFPSDLWNALLAIQTDQHSVSAGTFVEMGFAIARQLSRRYTVVHQEGGDQSTADFTTYGPFDAFESYHFLKLGIGTHSDATTATTMQKTMRQLIKNGPHEISSGHIIDEYGNSEYKLLGLVAVVPAVAAKDLGTYVVTKDANTQNEIFRDALGWAVAHPQGRSTITVDTKKYYIWFCPQDELDERVQHLMYIVLQSYYARRRHLKVGHRNSLRLIMQMCGGDKRKIKKLFKGLVAQLKKYETLSRRVNTDELFGAIFGSLIG